METLHSDLNATGIKRRRPLVLVVDDDATMRSLLRSALTTLGYDLRLAGSGDQARRELQYRRPDLILMDIRLNDSDGVALTREIKASPELATTPVVLISGDSRRDTLMSSIDAGAVDFITKPFNLEVLRSKLEKALRHPAALP